MKRRGSRLLIAEPPLQLLPSLAVAVGLNEALFLQQLHYWLMSSRHHHDGRAWVYNTYDEWHAQLPFWSTMTIRRIVTGLEKRNLIISTTEFNASKVDRTKWYAINYDELERVSKRPDQPINLNSPTDQDDLLDTIKLNGSDHERSQKTTQERKQPVSLEELAAETERFEAELTRLKRLRKAL